MRGSVRARFSVWFSAVSAARNRSRSLSSTSMPPGSIDRRAASPWTTCSDARRFVPASVSTRVPSGKSNAARLIAAGKLRARGAPVQPPGDHQVQHQPQIIVEADGDALADPAQLRDLTALRPESGGAAVRSKKGLLRRTRFRV